MFSRHLASFRVWAVAWIVSPLMFATAGADQQERVRLVETHATNKQAVLSQLQQMSRLAVVEHFSSGFKGAWRRVLIDGLCDGTDKQEFLRAALKKSSDEQSPLHKALTSLLESHRRLFESGRNAELMVRHASGPAFKPFGRLLTPAQALAEITAANEAKVQAFQTIFETGQNTRGYVHKLECHGQATEFIYAITDIVYGVTLPSELKFGADEVTADPQQVQVFYVKAGEVIALDPYVLHSGSLSVEPDRSFAILIYKQPATDTQQTLKLPAAWQQKQGWLKIAGVDKYYLTLAELHTDDLKTNRGFIADKRPIRLPTW